MYFGFLVNKNQCMAKKLSFSESFSSLFPFFYIYNDSKIKKIKTKNVRIFLVYPKIWLSEKKGNQR